MPEIDTLKERLLAVVKSEKEKGNNGIVNELASKIPCWSPTVYNWLGKRSIKNKVYRERLDSLLSLYEVKV